MRPNPRFNGLDKKFWANVRTIGQALGSTENQQVKVYTLEDFQRAMSRSALSNTQLFDDQGTPTELALLLLEYFEYRAQALNAFVEPRLMDVELNMGYAGEVLFGYEVVERLPSIAQEWVQLYHAAS